MKGGLSVPLLLYVNEKPNDKKIVFNVTFSCIYLLKFISRFTFAENEKEYNSLVVCRYDFCLCWSDNHAVNMDI